MYDSRQQSTTIEMTQKLLYISFNGEEWVTEIGKEEKCKNFVLLFLDFFVETHTCTLTTNCYFTFSFHDYIFISLSATTTQGCFLCRTFHLKGNWKTKCIEEKSSGDERENFPFERENFQRVRRDHLNVILQKLFFIFLPFYQL